MEESPELVLTVRDAVPRNQQTQYSYLILCGLAIVMTFVYIVYSQTRAYFGDEGFHMLSAQLISKGRLPYLDFFFPQTPLNAFWNAGWMRLFGHSWRVVHAVAAMLAMGAVFLTGDFVYRQFPVPRWRLAASVLALVLVGANIQVFRFAPLGQAYGMALFLSAVAFRLTVGAAGAHSLLPSVLAGLAAGAAATATLLAAPYAPVLLLWLIIYNRAGQRWIKASAYLLGTGVSWLPMVWLFLRSPYVVRFNVFDYHMRYRQTGWQNATRHDLRALTSWLDSSSAFVLGMLAIAGLIHVFRVAGAGSVASQASIGTPADPATACHSTSTAWNRQRRAEYYLCAWLAVAETIHISTAHPTFGQYFLLLVPPLSILATAGIYIVGSRQGWPDRPWWAVVPTVLILLLGTARTTLPKYENWNDREKIADKVKEVTPPGSNLLAEEEIYFLTNRVPPEGLEHQDALKLTVQPELAKMLHLISRAYLKELVSNGAFATVESCDEDVVRELGLANLYERNAKIRDCSIFWGLKRSMRAASQ